MQSTDNLLTRRWTAIELRRLQPMERDAVLAAAAAQAEIAYRDDPNLTSFEAFSKEELHGESTDTTTVPG